MDAKIAFGFLLCCAVCISAASSHMIIEDKNALKSCETNGNMINLPAGLPPISIVELAKTSKRISRTDAEKKKKKKKKSSKMKVVPKRIARPPPPPGCVPLWASCKAPSAPCCDFCALCQCKIFRTVCYCKMGYPNC
ncbi:agouti-signaling protein [Rhinatrema bivittatum]|uniref:agouti-signaling protein n=1 Tax=Rhinatrema bivittatum TaxID=194408 RepID=UPI001126F0C5|nr:agouti-signaling protein [Rhinatrema bivittatum]